MSPDLRKLLLNTGDSVLAKPMEGGQEQMVARVDRSAPVDLTGWHPSGSRITMTRWKNGVRRLWEVHADGTGLHQLFPDSAPAQDFFSWSPDGRRLYFSSGGDIYLLEGRRWFGWMHRPEPVRLTSGPTQFGAPIEDPANPLTAYAQGALPQAAAMKLNRTTNVFEPFLGGIPADSVEYSPDRQWIAYVQWPYKELWKCRSDGSRKTLLVEGLHCVAPHWSPDGTRIGFTAWKGDIHDTSGGRHIYTIPSSGGRPEPVPGVPGLAHDPTWSPDGKRLVFGAERLPRNHAGEQAHISILNLESGDVEVVPGSDRLWSPRWSPDGNWLAALGPDGLYIYRFSTGRWTLLAPGVVNYPRWSKDSRYVYALLTNPVMTLVRIPTAKPGEIEEIRKVQEFTMEWSAYWTADDEPIVLRDLTSYQIYRIDRDH